MLHDGGRKSNALYITEIGPRSVSGSAEWIEIYNPNDFAIDLNGWSFQHTSPSVNSNIFKARSIIRFINGYFYWRFECTRNRRSTTCI